MPIRKPSLSVAEARHLANVRLAAASTVQLPASTGSSPSLDPQVPAAVRDTSVGKAAGGSAGGGAVGLVQQDLAPLAKRSAGAKSSPRPVGTPPAYSVTSGERDEGSPFGLEQKNELSPPRYVSSAHFASSQVEKEQIFVSAPMPARGISPVFETLCRQYPPKKALQMILRRALLDYDVMLETGAFQKVPASYALDDTIPPDAAIQTSRMMPVSLVRVARAHFDPLGLESTRAFGRKLATAALAAFFSREVKGRAK